MKNLAVCFFIFLGFSCSESSQTTDFITSKESRWDESPQVPSASEPPTDSSIVVMVFSNDSLTGVHASGWGYDVFVNGKRFIHQTSVPLKGGSKGFETEAMARKAAEQVADKIRMGKMPPALDSSDLVSVGVEW